MKEEKIRKVYINKFLEGLRLNNSVYKTINGRDVLLVNQNTLITDNLIRLLKNNCIEYAYVKMSDEEYDAYMKFVETCR